MASQIQLIALTALIASVGMPTAQAKRQCNAAAPSISHGYWSWRLIDGRKCWYEGKPMVSKSSFEWPVQAPAESAPNEKNKSVPTESLKDPLDAEAWAPDFESFEALWRARVGKN